MIVGIGREGGLETGKAKAFLHTYGFLASLLPYTNAEWEKLSIFLNLLVPKLPAPIDDGLKNVRIWDVATLLTLWRDPTPPAPRFPP